MCAAHAMPEWRGKDSFAAEAASFGEIDLRARAENMPVALSMRVVAAPASFALPMVQRKIFKPPFTVRARPRCPCFKHYLYDSTQYTKKRENQVYAGDNAPGFGSRRMLARELCIASALMMPSVSPCWFV